MLPETTSVPATSSIGKLLAVIGSVFLFAPVAGLAITLWAMTRAFRNLSDSGPHDNMGVLSDAASDAMLSTTVGLLMWFSGVLLVYLAVSSFNYTPPWLYKTLIGASVIALPFFPIGTTAGICTLVWLFKHKNTFRVPAVP